MSSSARSSQACPFNPAGERFPEAPRVTDRFRP
jgi:hypothetical protein